jgi:hypothetical protein
LLSLLSLVDDTEGVTDEADGDKNGADTGPDAANDRALDACF